MKKVNKTILFLIITFIVSYSIAGVFYLCGGNYKSPQGVAIGVVYMFIPMLTVLLIEKGIYKEKIIDSLQIKFKFNKWFIIAICIPYIASLLSIVISLLFPDVTFSWDMTGMYERYKETLSPDKIEVMKQSTSQLPIHPFYLALISGLFAGITVNAIAAFGEELGWRGFLLRQFQKFSFIKTSLIIGFIWGIWHAPLILQGHNYPQHPVFGVFMMVIWCTLLSFIFIYITLKAKSVLAAAIIHGTLNAVAGSSIMLLCGGNDLMIGITGLSGCIALSGIIVLLFIYDKFISKENIMCHTITQSLQEVKTEIKETV